MHMLDDELCQHYVDENMPEKTCLAQGYFEGPLDVIGLGDVQIQSSECVRSLGVMIDNTSVCVAEWVRSRAVMLHCTRV
jgi:hypothetical protein